jgi:hypothetical protein
MKQIGLAQAMYLTDNNNKVVNYADLANYPLGRLRSNRRTASASLGSIPFSPAKRWTYSQCAS